MTVVEYLDFELEIGLGQGRDYPLAVLRSPGGEARERMFFPFDELALASHLNKLQIALLRSGGKRRKTLSTEESTVQEFGQKLFEALISGEIRSRYDVSQREAAQRGLGLRLKLRIQAPELAALPWEFLYDPRRAEYLCLSTQTPLVRYIELPQVIQPLLIAPPLRILGLTSSPLGLAALDTENEKERMERALTDLITSGQVQIDWLEHANRRELQRRLRRGPWHILHFIGHGGFDLASDEGFIALETERGELDRLPATQLARLLADHTSLRLAVLNSCEGAQGGNTDIFSSTASVLVRRGLPAVLAMQYEITDRAAIEFARGFYEALADNLPVDAATAEARKSVSLGLTNTIEWGTPVLFMRAPDGILFNIEQSRQTQGSDALETVEEPVPLPQISSEPFEKLKSRLEVFSRSAGRVTLFNSKNDWLLTVTANTIQAITQRLETPHRFESDEDKKLSQEIVTIFIEIGNFSIDLCELNNNVAKFPDRYELDLTTNKIADLYHDFENLLAESDVHLWGQVRYLNAQLDQMRSGFEAARKLLRGFEKSMETFQDLESRLSPRNAQELLQSSTEVIEAGHLYWGSYEEHPEHWEKILDGTAQKWFETRERLQEYGESVSASVVIRQSNLEDAIQKLNTALAGIDDFQNGLWRLKDALYTEKQAEQAVNRMLFEQNEFPRVISALKALRQGAMPGEISQIDALLQKYEQYRLRSAYKRVAKFQQMERELEGFLKQCKKVLAETPQKAIATPLDEYPARPTHQVAISALADSKQAPPRQASMVGGEVKPDSQSKKAASEKESSPGWSKFMPIILIGLLVCAFGLWGVSALVGTLTAAEPTPTKKPQLVYNPHPAEDDLFDAQGVPMRAIPAGTFQMGGDPQAALAECQKYSSNCDISNYQNEAPIHTVTLKAFELDKYEVTNALYQACVEVEACTPPHETKSSTRASYYGDSAFDNYPVIYVDWNQSKAYCEWRGARLPTEAEWEYAARGGLEGKIYLWGDTFEDGQANFCDTNCTYDWKSITINDGYADTSLVGNYASNGYGLHDLAGNVWEWTADWYGETYYSNSPASNPSGPASGQYRVLRGGSWLITPDVLRVSLRVRNTPDDRYYGYGFRCAR